MAESATDSAVYGLVLIADSFSRYPLSDVRMPRLDEWGKFLVEHANYLDERHQGLAAYYASDRLHSEVLEPHYQKLAGALIGVMHSQQELLEIS